MRQSKIPETTEPASDPGYSSDIAVTWYWIKTIRFFNSLLLLLNKPRHLRYGYAGFPRGRTDFWFDSRVRTV